MLEDNCVIYAIAGPVVLVIIGLVAVIFGRMCKARSDYEDKFRDEIRGKDRP